eukprot:37224-Eustigmatos_ZCMA.PRE.1
MLQVRRALRQASAPTSSSQRSHDWAYVMAPQLFSLVGLACLAGFCCGGDGGGGGCHLLTSLGCHAGAARGQRRLTICNGGARYRGGMCTQLWGDRAHDPIMTVAETLR